MSLSLTVRLLCFVSESQFLLSFGVIGACATVAVSTIMGRKVKALTKTLEGTQVRATQIDRGKQGRDLVLAVLVVHLLGFLLTLFVILGPIPVS